MTSCTSDPFKVALEVVDGYDFSLVVAMVDDAVPAAPVDLTGRVYTAHVRHAPDGALLTAFTVTVPTPANGEVVLSLDEAQTAVLADAGPAGLSWSLKEDAGGVTTAVLAGPVLVRRVVTP